MSSWETWTFGVTAHLSWTSVVPLIHFALGTQAIFVWVPAVIVGMLINYQVKHLGRKFIDVAGGTPSYSTKLWQRYPIIGTYGAIGYILGWLSFISVNSVVLTDIIEVNLELLGLSCPELLLKVTFNILPFIVAFRGTKALSILHLFFALPAFVILVAFCFQGLGFLAFAADSPGFFPNHWSSLSFGDWAKWFVVVAYSTYACETASCFVADSSHPAKTLKFLNVAAWLMPLVFVGGSWVVMRLATVDGLGNNAFLNFVAASTPFWGNFAAVIATFLLAGSCLLGSATAVSNCPRIIYQLSIDKRLAPVFSIVSPRGVFGSALTLCLFLCMLYFFWGDVSRIVIVGNVSWFISFVILHLGMWQKRDNPAVIFPGVSLAIYLLEFVVFLVSAYVWGWTDFLIGLLAPLVVLIINALVVYLPINVFRPQWWIKLYQSQHRTQIKDSLMLQVIILIFLLCGAVLVGYLFGWKLNLAQVTSVHNLVVILLMTVAFVGVAIACWTSLPQVVALAEAREAAEHLFQVAQDGILVVDDQGIIRQANPATEAFFGLQPVELLGQHLQKWFPTLAEYPEQWSTRSEQTLNYQSHKRTFELSISDRPHQDFPEYVVILHDITQRKQAEEILRQSEAQLRQEAQQLAAQLVQSEKMSSLGQLVAGVAHEINNPVSFIYGNVAHAKEYIQDLIQLLQIYQEHYPEPKPEVQMAAEAIDLNFLIADLPKLLNSMQIGAKRISDIVISLRNFSRLDESEIKAVNIHEGIDSTLMILENRLKSSSDSLPIQIIKNYGDLPLVECYAGQLNQVFMNILVNAIDALEELIIGNNLFVKPQISIHTEITQEQQVMICIADNATGISESVRQHLFEPFFTTKPVGKGTGLGLSISYQIITKKHRGNLSCISAVGKGTEFVITIPLHQ
jgi:PAS domain S-box-containing protein